MQGAAEACQDLRDHPCSRLIHQFVRFWKCRVLRFKHFLVTKAQVNVLADRFGVSVPPPGGCSLLRERSRCAHPYNRTCVYYLSSTFSLISLDPNHLDGLDGSSLGLFQWEITSSNHQLQGICSFSWGYSFSIINCWKWTSWP